MANQNNGDEEMLSRASELYLEIKDAIEMEDVQPGALEEYLKDINDYIRDISANNFPTQRRDGLTKEGILIDLENMKVRINGLLATGGRRRKSRRARRARRTRRSKRTRRSRRARK
jgi:hypothetical protein